jgi:hypothetical protein
MGGPFQETDMPKIHAEITERILKLAPGKSCVVPVKKLDFRPARRPVPDAQWRTESIRGGLVVTRVR